MSQLWSCARVFTAFLVLVAPVQAEEDLWTGPWLATGDAEWKYVDGVAPHVSLRAVFPGLGRVELKGEAAGDRMVLRGEAERRPEGLQGRGRPHVVLEARPSPRSPDALEVSLSVDGHRLPRTRWHRPSTPKVRVLTRELSYTPQPSRPLKVVVEVSGRPQPLRFKVLCASGYDDLDGLVHYEETEVLPVGRHTLTWDGRDRSAYRKPAQSGAYTVVVEAIESVLGPPPAERGARRPTPTGQLALNVTASPAAAAEEARKRVPLVPDWPELTDPDAGWPISGYPPGLTKKGLANRLHK